ncbi:MAG: PRC-barrel domain-containing protein [Candidatus Thermoplasmatota archaeon]|nr:PRC-barrel domain-containing protein [Candidatus Thermoplasmatota archaeon]
MAIFGREIIGNTVVDRTGAVLGSLVDLNVDLNTGMISELLVEVEATVDAAALPFDHSGNKVHVPGTAVARIAENIHLSV